MITLTVQKGDKPPSVATELLAGMAGFLKSTQLRLVTSYSQLREKIRIFEAGLNDELIELLKLIVWEKAFGTAVVPDDSVFFTQKRSRLFRGTQLVFELYRGTQRLGEAALPWDIYAETMAEAGIDPTAGAGEWKLINQSALHAAATEPSPTTSDAKSKTVPFHLIGPDGSETRHLQIGPDISESQYRKLADPQTGAVYGLTVYENGTSKTTPVTKRIWEEAQAQFGEIDRAGEDAIRRIRDTFKGL